MKQLTDSEIDLALQHLPGWRRQANTLVAEYNFGSFATAIEFMVQVGRHAEELNHHPDWRNIYGRVIIDLSTHDVGGVTELDIRLATKINEVAQLLDGGPP